MERKALFVRHRAKPGQRNRVEEIWSKFVKPRVEANPNHEAYFFCHDEGDPDVICVFQLFRSREAIQEFMSGDWYSLYLAQIMDAVAEPPQISEASPSWIKTASLTWGNADA